MYIILTYYSDSSSDTQVQLARTIHDMARIFKDIEGYGLSYRIFHIAEHGPIREIMGSMPFDTPQEVGA